MKANVMGIFGAVCTVLVLTGDVTWSQTPVSFYDAALEAQVRLVLSKPTGDIYTSDMETLDYFGSSGEGIVDLTGLEYATNLLGLYLSENAIADLSPLSGLPSLLELDLFNNQVSDISPLASITTLTTLNLHANEVSDLTPLSGLAGLKNLNLRDNQIVDIGVLSGLTGLMELNLGNNQISDIGALSSLGGLLSLDLGGNSISDVGPLAGMTGMQGLDLWSNQISDISSLSGLLNLGYLHVEWNQISDISMVGGMTQLVELRAQGNQISDLSDLTSLTQLVWVLLYDNPLGWQAQCEDLQAIRDNNPNLQDLSADPNPYDCGVPDVTVNIPDPALKAAVMEALDLTEDPKTSDMVFLTTLEAYERGIVDLTGLAYAPNLWYLDLSRNAITDLGPLAGLTGLRHLTLESNQITDAGPLSGLVNLTDLQLNGNDISSLDFASSLASLVNLSVGENQISDLDALSGLLNLESLRLDGNPLIDLSGLGGVGQLKWLSLANTQVTDLSPLTGLSNLETLHACCNGLADLGPLSGLTKLQYLGLDWNEITDLSPLATLVDLTGMNLIGNSVVELAPLTGMTHLTFLGVQYSPLSYQSYCSDIPTILSKNPGIELYVDPNPYDCSIPNVPVTFVDTALKAAVMEALGLDTDPLTSDMAQLHSLQADNRGISNLTGLEHAVNLYDLRMNGNDITDITPLVGLTSLFVLRLNENSIGDMGAVTGLTSLERLELYGNQIGSIPELSGLKNLTRLDLNGNQINEASGLAGLSALERLYLAGNQISTLPDLSSLTNLTMLELGNNPIVDLSGLSDLPSLTELFLRGCQLGSISELSGLSTLTVLELGENQLADISPLYNAATSTGLVNLTYLGLDRNQVSDIGVLQGLTSLEVLMLQRNQISDISSLTAMTNLIELNLKRNPLSWEAQCPDKAAIIAKNLNLQEFITDPSPYDCSIPNVPVVFVDPALQAAVEAQLGVTDPTTADMALLGDLRANNAGITDLTGLEYARNLGSLQLNGNQIANISPLSGLTNLETLRLNGNQIANIGAVLGLTRLERLELDDNQISIVPDLSGLIHLTQLRLSGNQIGDISNLAAVTSLTRLFLANNQISDASDLAGLIHLERLDLSNNLMSDISTLTDLMGLRRLFLSNNQLSDISDLAGLTNLEQLILTDNQISDISVLADLPNLYHLNLGYNRVNDVTVQTLSTMTGLTRLYLYENELTKVTALSTLVNLTLLNLSSNDITDVEPLSGLTNLDYLHLGWNDIGTVSWLSGMTKLTELHLQSNGVSDISALSGMTQMESLRLHNNQIVDISPLSGMTNLMENKFWVHDNQIIDIGPLVPLVAGWSKLELHYNWISDVSPLAALVGLNVLNLDGNPLSQESCCTWIPVILDNNPNVNLSSQCSPLDCIPANPITRVFEDDFSGAGLSPEWSTFGVGQNYIGLDEGRLSIDASGADIWREFDEYGAVYTPAIGDFEVIVKIENQEATHDWAKAGIVVRNDGAQAGESLGYASMLITPQRYSFQWDDDAGSLMTSLDLLKNHPDYPDSPHGTELLDGFETPEWWGDYYGQRVSGTITPAVAGNYTFYIGSDDNGELWLSSDADPANIAPIASVPDWSFPTQYDKFPEQQSSPVLLQAGQTYYIEALHKEGAGGDGLTVAWQLENGPIEVIPGSFLREWWMDTDVPDGDGYLDHGTDSPYGSAVYPSWLRLKKVGTTFSGSYSVFGAHGPWTNLGSATLDAANTVQDVGLLVSSHVPDVTCEVLFDDFYLADEATRTGLDVEVSDPDAGVAMTFDYVEAIGETTVDVSQYGPTTPAGFQLGDPPTYYDITTTASYTGSIEICIYYGDVAFSGPEEDLRLLHFDSHQGWVDCTTSVDMANNLIYGEVDSLSPFVVALGDPLAIIENLAAEVEGLGLPGGTANSLLAKLDTALKKLNDANQDNDTAASNALRAFMNEVNAQSGKKIPESYAKWFVTAAEMAIGLIPAG